MTKPAGRSRLAVGASHARWREDATARRPRAVVLGCPAGVLVKTPDLPFTPAERRLVARLRTPARVQHYLNELPYNRETEGETLRTFRCVVRHHTVHCLEAAIFAAAVLEQHGYPPTVLSLESIDDLDHVLFVYRRDGRWGSVARSRDPGLHGRKAVFRSLRELALSYVDPYVDFTGRITGYGLYDLRQLDPYDWRLSMRNVWKVEQVLIDLPHRSIRSSDARIDRLRRAYRAFKRSHPDARPAAYRGRERWTELPRRLGA